MVTDAAIGDARTEATIPYGGRVVITVLLLGLYLLGHLVALPLLDADFPLSSTLSPGSVMALGLAPLIIGFILVELFSLMTSPGRRLRKGGAAGRARLNRAALAGSLLLAAAQALRKAIHLESLFTPDGPLLVQHPGLAFRLLIIATLTAATAAVFVIGQLLSAYGIGNGFALLILAQVGWSAAAGWTTGKGESINIVVLQTGLLLAAAMLLLVFLYIRRADTEWLPAFPQSILPAYWSPLPFLFLQFLWQFGIFAPSGNYKTIKVALVVIPALVLLPILSWLTFHLFSSRSRLEANLEETEEFLNDSAARLRRRAFYATAILALGTGVELAWGHYWHGTLVLSFVNALMTAAIVLDLWDQFRFLRQKGPTALLVQLDNVHFSYRLEERLQEEGVDALARGHQLRSLYFFFGPLFKIDVLVPCEQLPRARQVLCELEVASEVKVF